MSLMCFKKGLVDTDLHFDSIKFFFLFYWKNLDSGSLKFFLAYIMKKLNKFFFTNLFFNFNVYSYIFKYVPKV